LSTARISWRSAGALLAAGSAGSMVLLGLTAAAPAGASSTPGMVAVSQGLSVAAPGAQPVFPVKASDKEIVSFVLKMRNEAALERRADAGIKGHFLSVAQFRTWYGQPAARIRALEKYLHARGIKTSAYGDNLDVTATGTAGQFDKALSVTQDVYKSAAIPATDGQAAKPSVLFHAAREEPLLPASLARYVETIVGLDNYPMFASDAVHTPTAEPAKTPAGLYSGARTPADFARNYGLEPVYKKGAKGQGQTLGIITYASLRPYDATHFWSSVIKIKTKSNRIRLDKVDGGSGPVSAARGSDETSLDVEQSGAVAPQASIVVYEAPNSDVGTIDAYATAASQNVAGTVSTSWGESETVLAAGDAGGTEPSTLIQANDEFLLEMAAQGQANFTASGDAGAYAASEDLGSTNLSVQNPADSPWTTAAGATTLAGEIPLYSQISYSPSPSVIVHVKSQRAWGWDYQWRDYSLFACNTGTAKNPDLSQCTSEAQFAPQYVVGDGGGYSRAEERPGYQRRIRGIGSFTAVPYLTPTDDQPTSKGSGLTEPMAWTVWDSKSKSVTPPVVIKGTAAGRAVPDISADGDPYTGYELYYRGLQLGWGGTSFVAPQLNGSAAVIDSYLGRRVGFWNPAIYKFATLRNSPFSPMDTSGAGNDNIYYSGTKGARYNPATGLGTPNLAQIAADFARYGW
jgi:kumamolisin